MSFEKNVVLDTNIWVSYIIGAKLEELVHLIMDNDIQVFTSKALIDELTTVLSRTKFKKYLSLPIEEYILFHQELTIFSNIEPFYNNSPDPKDNFLFDLAIQNNAAYIVTGDKLLLNSPKSFDFEFITLSAYKSKFI